MSTQDFDDICNGVTKPNNTERKDVIDLTMVDYTLSPSEENNYKMNQNNTVNRHNICSAYRPPRFEQIECNSNAINTYHDDYSVDSFDLGVEENENIDDDIAAHSPSSMSSVSIDKAFYETTERDGRNDQLPGIEEVRNMSIMMLKNAQDKNGKRNKLLSTEDIRKMSAILMKKRRKEEKTKKWNKWKKNKWSDCRQNFLSIGKGKETIVRKVIVSLLFVLVIAIIFLGLVITSKPSERNNNARASVDDSSFLRPGLTNVGGSRLSLVVDFLREYSDPSDLVTLGTPQNLAAKWIADTDERHLQIEDSEKFLQRYALAVFYFATGGPTFWPQKLGFLSSSDECLWFNLGHDDVSTEVEVGASCLGTDQIRQLVLAPQSLQGTIPHELRLLPNLEHISIFSNPRISGPFPESLKEMTNLNYLLINSCAFENKIPSWIGNLSSLKTLRLSNNGLIGSLPPQLSKLKQLKTLMLDNNNLLGSVNLFETLPRLKVLSAKNNMLHGVMGTTFFDTLKYLKVLDFSMNQINSTLPKNMFHGSELSILNLGSNQLHGTIPDVVDAGYHPYDGKLEYLALNKNRLTGLIPSSISKLKFLTNLDLSSNILTATLPEELGSLTNLNYILLEKNHFAEDDEKLATIIENLGNLKGVGIP